MSESWSVAGSASGGSGPNSSVAVAGVREQHPIPARSWSAPRRTAARRRSAPRSARRLRPAAACRPRPARPDRPLAPAETAHAQRGHVRVPGPGRLELRPKGEQHQHRSSPPMRSITRPRSSSVVGSIQCRSLNSASTGCCAARPASWSTSASKVCRFCTSGREGQGPDSASRSAPRAGPRSAARPPRAVGSARSSASSLSSLVAADRSARSRRRAPAAR